MRNRFALLAVSAAMLLPSVSSASLYINEVLFNPPGTDAPNEYVEIRGTPNAVLPSGTYLVGIEGDAASVGDVQNIFDLSGKTLGSNGFLVLLQKSNTYATSPLATVLTNSGTGAGWGSGAGSSVGHSADASATDIENVSNTLMLIQAATAPLLTDDIDANNDGTPDGAVFAGWTVLDAVGSLDNSAAGDFAYGLVNFINSTGGGVATSGTTVSTSFSPGYIGRIGDSTGATAADWVAGDTLGGTAPNFALDTDTDGDGVADFLNLSEPALAGSPLNHIGSSNPVVPEPATMFVLPLLGLVTLRRRTR